MSATLGEVRDLSVAQDDLQYPAVGLKASARCGTSFLDGKCRQLEVASLHRSTGHQSKLQKVSFVVHVGIYLVGDRTVPLIWFETYIMRGSPTQSGFDPTRKVVRQILR